MVHQQLMCCVRIHPDEVQRWFLERYFDSYEWVRPERVRHGQIERWRPLATKPHRRLQLRSLNMGDFKRGPGARSGWPHWPPFMPPRHLFRATAFSMMVSCSTIWIQSAELAYKRCSLNAFCARATVCLDFPDRWPWLREPLIWNSGNSPPQ